MPRSLPARCAVVLFLSWRTLGEGQESSGRRWAVQFGHVEFEPLKMCEALSSLAPITLCNLVLAPHLSSPRSLVTLSFLLLHKHTMSAFASSDASAENVFLSSLACRVPGHYLAQIPCLLRKLSDSPKKCPLRWAPSTVTDRCLALSTSSHRSVYMSMFLTRWLFYRGKELLLIILYTISMKILHCVCQLSLLGDEYLECHTVDDSGGMRAGQCGDGVLGIWKPARVKETGTRSSGWTNKKHLSQSKNSLLAWHLFS